MNTRLQEVFPVFTFKYELTVLGETIHLVSKTTPAQYFAGVTPIVGTIGDHNVQTLFFERPGFEEYDLVLLFESEGTERTAFPEQNLAKGNEFVLTKALTQNLLLHMQVRLRDGQEIIASSQSVSMAFRSALTPGTAAIELHLDPVETIVQKGVTHMAYSEGVLSTYNQYGQPLESVAIDGGQGQGGLLGLTEADQRYASILYGEKSGGPSIALDDVSPNSPFMAGLVIGGATVQNGTPSPNEPVPIDGATPTTLTLASDSETKEYALPDTPPLYGQDAIADTYDTVNGVITRRYALVTLTGESSISTAGTIDGYSTFIIIGLSNLQKTQAVNGKKCTHFPAVGNNTNPQSACIYQGINTQYLYFRVPETLAASVAEFKAWLAAQNSTGTPVKVLYRVTDPITTSLDRLQRVPMYAPNCTVTTDTGTLRITYPQDTGKKIAVLQAQIDSLLAAIQA